MTQVTRGKQRTSASHQDAASAGVSSMAEVGQWTDKLRIMASPAAEGRYQVTWYCEIKMEGGNGSDCCAARVAVDGAIAGSTSHDRNVYVPFTGSAYGDFDDGDEPSVALQFQLAGSAGGTARIRRARVGIVRVGDKSS